VRGRRKDHRSIGEKDGRSRRYGPARSRDLNLSSNVAAGSGLQPGPTSRIGFVCAPKRTLPFASNLPAVIGPVQQSLALARSTPGITRVAVPFDFGGCGAE
jgi:hypothetical protein